MKKVITFLLSAVVSVTSFSQSFDKGSRNFDFKVDFARYNGTAKDNLSKDVTDLSVSSLVLSPQMSWGAGKKVSIGTSLVYSHYFDSTKADKQVKPNLNGLDANFLFDFHLIRKSKADIMVGFKVGIAGIRYNPNDATGDIYGSIGTATELHLMARFYISEKVGIIANLSMPGYRFGEYGKNLFDTSTVKLRGFCIGTGLAINLSKKEDAATGK